MPDLTPAPLWEEWRKSIGAQFRDGTPFADIFEMNLAIKQRDLAPYEAHIARLRELFDPFPRRVIEFGAGYGAMAGFWPQGTFVTNIDLPEMLEIQREYIGSIPIKTTMEFVPFDEAERVDFKSALFFAVWSLTETTPATWEFYMERMKDVAGAYVVGFHEFDGNMWPTDRLADCFRESAWNAWPADPGVSFELVGWND